MTDMLCISREECCKEAPDCLRDLDLLGFLEGIIQKETHWDLAPWFYTPLQNTDQVRFRQEILKDLQKGDNLNIWDRFTDRICSLAQREQEEAEDLHSGEPWRCHDLLYGRILADGEDYVLAVSELEKKLLGMELCSQGLKQAEAYIQELVSSADFLDLSARQSSLRREMDGIQYIMQIRYGVIRVKKYEGEPDIAEQIAAAFQKFQGEDQKDYRQTLKEEPYADHVEAAVLRCLSRLWPREFEDLQDYAVAWVRHIPGALLKLCRELRFYVDWLRAIGPMADWGLPFCYPTLGEDRAWARQIYDLALANRIGSAVVRNDMDLEPGERTLVITGPNQGGKTTFARALGQVHYLASLGLSVPGTGAELQLPDRVLTHFPREETEVRGSGRLREELLRLGELLDCATDRSLLILNEIFSSTNAEEGLELGEDLLRRLEQKGTMTVLVTFLSELAGPGRVSMVSGVDPLDPARRTFRLDRRPPENLTYAMTLARKYDLTYEQIQRRLKP